MAKMTTTRKAAAKARSTNRAKAAVRKRPARKKGAKKPTKKKSGNRTKFTDRARENFLAVLRETCNVTRAAAACGISRRTAYDHRKADETFAELWDDAEQEAVDRLEREAWRRGVEGVDKPITYQGEITATYKDYSDRMLELLLKAHRPAKYRERFEHTGKDGAPLDREVNIIVISGKETDAMKRVFDAEVRRLDEDG